MPLVSLQPRIEYLSSRLSVVVAEADGLFGIKQKKMIKKFNSKRPSGSKNEPKVMSEVLNEYIESNEPIAAAFRNWVTECEAAKAAEEEDEDQLFRNLWPNSELDVTLKLLTRKPGRLPIGEPRDGSLVRDSEEHFTFVENALEEKVGMIHRTPCIYQGTFINVHRGDDGRLYATFKRPRVTKDFTFEDFCCDAAEELIYVARLVERKRLG